MPLPLNTLSRAAAASFGGHFRDADDMRVVRRSEQVTHYYHQGIIDDCCVNACTYRTLLSYCATYQ